VRSFGFGVTALATGLAAAVGLAASAYAVHGSAPSLAAPFALGGLGLAAAGIFMALRARSDLIEIILGGLAGRSLGVTRAEMSSQAASIEDHYKSLWVPAAIATLLVSFLAFRSRSMD